MSYFIAKVQEKFEDEETGKVKSKSVQYLVNAESVTESEAKVYKLYEGSTVPFEVKSVQDSRILEVIN